MISSRQVSGGTALHCVHHSRIIATVSVIDEWLSLSTLLTALPDISQQSPHISKSHWLQLYSVPGEPQISQKCSLAA